MPHEKMSAWLEKANSGAVQAAADRLLSAATEIDRIGEELKIRPQIVDWKGAGANSFRTWSADLANATLRLGLYSREASKRLGEAAEAIVSAKAAAPQPEPGAEATLKAALSARNDPDASALATKLGAEKDAMAREMTKLSQAYNQSVDGIGALKKPEFPPPPKVIAPDPVTGRDHADGYVSDGGAAAGAAGAMPRNVSTPGAGYESPGGAAAPSTAHSSVTAPVGGTVSRPVDMEIDGVATPPKPAPNPSVHQPEVPGLAKPDGGLPVTPAVLPPSIGGRTTVQAPSTNAGGRATGISRPPMPSATGNPVAGPMGKPSRDTGIVGGRPAAQTSGRPAGGLPRGTVIGSEGTHAGRGVMGQGAGMGGAGGGGQSGIVGGRRLAGETGGIVGGRPQQPGRAGTRPFTPGGTGLVRGTAMGDGSRGVGQVGRVASHSPRAGALSGDERERPDYLVENEETWQQGDRRVVPPVID
ncbi:WXG100 family type VII secretion target [Streptomyces sp. NPDC057729]|uniref:WXG100 family type VII secretion target n=1 Tax=Streptomyces sp. NPDC057729 TaxID=3346230 RepID=UPI0036793536